MIPLPIPFLILTAIGGAGLGAIIILTWHQVSEMCQDLIPEARLFIRVAQGVVILVSLGMVVAGIAGIMYG